ncbi:taurine catabolism dioxygenase [Phellopilus nigrolimitatus]|nr:taurine catabolism dioxygenase [Phellopilus nigrolimitatus]
MSPQVNGSLHTNGNSKAFVREPLVYSGSLDQFKSADVTPVIGREFPDVQLTDLMKSEDADAFLKDLAITISQRGVVFFRNQDIGIEHQKEFVQRLGELSGKPESSKLHVHPLIHSPENTPINEQGDTDPHVYVISSKSQGKLYKSMAHRLSAAPASAGWHSDLTFENVPSDYACLKLTTTPPSGGDTLWASGYEVYDRISPSMREYFSTLTATHAQPVFKRSADDGGFPIASPRGAPENVGDEFSVSHPVVRTNPVTGWRSIYSVGLHCNEVDGITTYEAKWIKEYIEYLITHNHDLQVRFKWNANDVAIWDNRSVYHTATPDLVGVREGHRTTSLGERPYFDPASTSRREALAAAAAKA